MDLLATTLTNVKLDTHTVLNTLMCITAMLKIICYFVLDKTGMLYKSVIWSS